MQDIEYKKQHSPKSISNAEQWEGVSSISPLCRNLHKAITQRSEDERQFEVRQAEAGLSVKESQSSHRDPDCF